MGSGRYFRENMGLTLQTCPFYWKRTPSVSLQPPPGSLSLAPLSAGENLKDEPFSLENIYSHFQLSLENTDPTTEVTQGPVPS